MTSALGRVLETIKSKCLKSFAPLETTIVAKAGFSAIAFNDSPSTAAKTTRALVARRCSVLPDASHKCRVAKSSEVNSTRLVGAPISLLLE